MDSTLFIIGIIGNIISVLVFVSPIPTFWRIVRSKSTEEFEPAPYVLTLLSSLLWFYYGITKPDGLLVATVNGFGAVMETIYVALFIIYSADHATRVKTAKLVAAFDIGFFGLVFGTTTFAIAGLDFKIMIIGLICACLNVFMYGSPLASVRTVIASKSVEYMPFFLSFFLFLNGGVWATYALLDRDVFLGVPNGMGFFLGAIQLAIYAVYKNSMVKSQSSDKAAYQGLQTASAPLLSSDANKDFENKGRHFLALILSATVVRGGEKGDSCVQVPADESSAPLCLRPPLRRREVGGGELGYLLVRVDRW